MKVFLKKSGGFSFVQVIISMGLMMGIVMFMTQQQSMLKKNKVSAEFSLTVDEAAGYVHGVLSDPYSCMASVEGTVIGSINGPMPVDPTQPKLGLAQDGILPVIRKGINNHNYDPTKPGDKFYLKEIPLVKVNDEVKKGVVVMNINLVNDGVKNFIRVSFSPHDRTKGLKNGGQILNKDFILTGKVNGGVFEECNLELYDAAFSAGCSALKGEWDPVIKGCLLVDFVNKAKDLIPMFKLSNGTLSTTPALATVEGHVSCVCSTSSCVGVCTCTTPSCVTLPACAPPASCGYGGADNWNNGGNCMYRRQCGTTQAPVGYLVIP